MPSDDSPTHVREEHTGDYGVYFPERDVILTYIGNDEVPITGAYVGENWHEVEYETLTASIEDDIEDVREDIEALRNEELTEEQEQKLDSLESRLESQENVLEIHKEVREDGDD